MHVSIKTHYPILHYSVLNKLSQIVQNEVIPFGMAMLPEKAIYYQISMKKIFWVVHQGSPRHPQNNTAIAAAIGCFWKLKVRPYC